MLTREEKTDIIKTYGKSATNTGLSEAQIAIFTTRINKLTDHLRIMKKDYSTQTALIRLVGKRRSLLNYLHHKDITRYRKIIAELGIRK